MTPVEISSTLSLTFFELVDGGRIRRTTVPRKDLPQGNFEEGSSVTALL
jgi:hypothetical protein